jgi:hypothetical protein
MGRDKGVMISDCTGNKEKLIQMENETSTKLLGILVRPSVLSI